MNPSVNVKMYRVGELGDCFLLTLKHNENFKHILIDCGSFRNSNSSITRLNKIAEDIQKQVSKNNGQLDVVVGTHQHNDHVSGFVHAESVFKNIPIENVWLSWLDDPKNKQAQKIGQSHLELRKALMQASAKMSSLTSKPTQKSAAMTNKMKEVHSLIDGLLEFFGAAPQLPAQGIENLKNFGTNGVQYLSPGDVQTVNGIPETAVKIHVLGPPENEDLLYRKDPKKGESYEMRLKSFNAMAQNFIHSLNNRSNGDDKEEEQFPFNSDYKRYVDKRTTHSPALRKVIENYSAKHNDWRNIDEDWMDLASRMALYMDSFTNNSSLVLAIELVKTGKVLLFAADAQTGNWVSWDDVKLTGGTTIDSLLERTVFYKVGHHGSHNSTLKGALERMTNPELVAMIPVDKKDPNITKKNGWKMPATKLYQRLKEKTNLRVLLMDDGYADDCDPSTSTDARKSWNKLASKPNITDLYVEFTIS
jgi:beta-lactamase superfamily II metal-dependent hydrolase